MGWDVESNVGMRLDGDEIFTVSPLTTHFISHVNKNIIHSSCHVAIGYPSQYVTRVSSRFGHETSAQLILTRLGKNTAITTLRTITHAETPKNSIFIVLSQ